MPAALVWLLLAALLGACRVPASPVRPRSTPGVRDIRLSITVDDLPGVGGRLPGWTNARILRGILETLQRHHVPGAVGFFSGSNMDPDPETTVVLNDWLAAGYLLGNHSFSHGSAEQMGASAFMLDVERNTTLLHALGVPEVRYFRYPYLERGRAEDRPRIRAALAQQGLRVADVSVDYEDWAFAAAFARCTELGDQPALADLADHQMRIAMAELFWSSETAYHVLKRPIPHVLLIHANLFTAQKLDDVLNAYERAGVKFVSYEETQQDPVYAALEDDGHGDFTLIEALIRASKSELRSFMPPPRSLLDLVCPLESAEVVQHEHVGAP